jgi:apolipoprotein N-acyltransferase
MQYGCIYSYFFQMALCGFLLGLSAPGINLWPMAWLALIPALMLSNRCTSLKTRFTGGYLLGFIYHGLYCLWFFDLHPLAWMGFGELESRLVTLAGWLLIAIEGGLISGLLMMLYPQLKPGLQRLLLFPLLWVFVFALLNCTPMALPWAYLEYTQASLWPIRWLAGWISGSGIAFLIVLHNVFWRWTFGNSQQKWLLKVVQLFLFPLLMTILQFFPAPRAQQPSLPLPIAIAQANLPIELVRSGQLTRTIIEQAYIFPVENAAIPPGSLLIYPEEGVVPGWIRIENPASNSLLQRLTLLAQKKQVYIAVGLSTVDAQNRHYNSIALISPNSRPIQFYHKRRLVPFGEFTPYGFGSTLTSLLAGFRIDYSTPYDAGLDSPLLQAGKTRLGGLVCFELIDTAPIIGGYAMQYKHQGADLLINTSNLGWFHENPLLEAQFLSIAQIRAAETRLPLAISSNTGISAILSAQGDILKQRNTQPEFQHKTQIVFYNSD